MNFYSLIALLSFICFLIAGAGVLVAQGQRFRVVNDESGEPLTGATVFSKKLSKGCMTDDVGQCRIAMAEEGTDTLTVSAPGYLSLSIPVRYSRKDILIALRQKVYEMEAVPVTTDRDDLSPEIFGAVRYDRAMLAGSSLAGGESDPFASVASEPGLTPMSDFSAGLRVRGLGFMHNQILFDGVELYHPYHLVGFISTFPGPIIDELVLYRDGTPPSYGGKLSSVIDIRSVTPDTTAIHGTFNLSLINASASVNIPLGKSVASLISIRSLYLDPVVRSITDDAIQYSFQDGFMKTMWKPGKNGTLSVSALYSRDNSRIDEGFWRGTIWRAAWSSWMSGVEYDHSFSDGATLRLSAGLSEFAVYQFKDMEGWESWDSWLRDYSARFLFSRPFQHHRLNCGFDIVLHATKYSRADAIIIYDIEPLRPDIPHYASESAAYVEDILDIAGCATLTGGMRFVHYNRGDFVFAEPRVAIHSSVSDRIQLRLGYQQIHQFTHAIPETGLPFPMVERFHCSKDITPASINSIAAGVSIQGIFGVSLNAEINSYYRTYSNLYEMNGYYNYDGYYRIHISKSTGEAYGLEASLRGIWSRVIGSLNLSIGRSLMQSPEIDEGNIYPSRYEIRAETGAAISYKPWNQWQFDLSWAYMTGAPMTVPIGKTTTGYIYSHRNAYYLPSQHWLDIKATYYTTMFGLQSTLYLHIHNVYNKNNAFYSYVFEKDDPFIPESTNFYEFTRTSVLPIVPSIGFSMAF